MKTVKKWALGLSVSAMLLLGIVAANNNNMQNVAFNPQPDPPGVSTGFNPQPDPPGVTTVSFNPQPDPPGATGGDFNPQPDPPGAI